uniref:Uncharacterized protein n=1 Tax=Tetraselmis sp. GSL018 TaxID=582737 RepID=A0A061QW88_9CHLO
MGGEHALSSKEQLQHIEALKVLDTGLTLHEAEMGNPEKGTLSGLNVRLYHPDAAPMDTVVYKDDDSGAVNMEAGTMRSHVGDDGVVHLVADRATMRAAIRALDISRAQLLTRLSQYWLQRVQSLTPAVTELLRVENVWADTRSEAGSQKFVLWAGALLERRADFEAILLPGSKFSFSVLVHSELAGPMVDFLAASCVLQVRSDCPPRILLEYMRSEAAKEANLSAESSSSSREIEEDLLGRVRQALGAKHVIRVCSMLEQEKVLDGARRLLENASSIKEAVNLTGASIALDDCYEVWESGFISIPYDFNLGDLEPQLRQMLGSTSSAHRPETDLRDLQDMNTRLPENNSNKSYEKHVEKESKLSFETGDNEKSFSTAAFNASTEPLTPEGDHNPYDAAGEFLGRPVDSGSSLYTKSTRTQSERSRKSRSRAWRRGVRTPPLAQARHTEIPSSVQCTCIKSSQYSTQTNSFLPKTYPAKTTRASSPTTYVPRKQAGLLAKQPTDWKALRYPRLLNASIPQKKLTGTSFRLF